MAQGPAVSIALRGMGFAAGTAPLFGPLSLEVPGGQVLALIGPSGIGKTTLLRILAGLEQRFDGEVRIGGSSPAEAPPPGMVFQDARLLPWLDAAANIRAVQPAITPGDLSRLLARVGLAGTERAFPHQLSGGMQRRLGLARALAVNSGLLLLDEPFVSLDRPVVAELQDLFRSILAQHGPTVILVSHDPEDAARLADRVVILAGRPAQVIADIPLTPATSQAALARNLARIRAATAQGRT